MNPRTVAVLMVAALGLAACGSDSDSPAGNDSLPPVSDGSPPPVSDGSPPPVSDGSQPPVANGYQHPTGDDEVVVEYAEVGGFMPREFAFRQTPNVLVSGDGRLFGPGAQIEIYPGPLLPAVQVQAITEEAIQAILVAADEAGLLQQVDYEQPMNIADASTARLTINVNGETYVHEAYALGLAGLDGGQETTPERQALADFLAQLSDPSALVGADQLGEQTIVEPSEYGIEAIVVQDLSVYSEEIEPTVADWPATVSVRLADATACTVVPAEEVGETLVAATQLTFFTDGDTTYQVLAKPILPGTVCG